MMFLKSIRNSHHNSENGVIAALDIGNSKVCCAIARSQGTEGYRVIGVGCQSSKGLKNGHIIDMQEAELSILNAVHLAEQMAKESIRRVYVSLPLCHSKTVGLELPITGNSVDQSDIRRLLHLTQQVSTQKSLELVHTIPMNYDIDGREGIKDPSGMFGDKLGVTVHKIYSDKSHLRNLTTCINRCHLEAESFVSGPLASGLASLVEDEMELGAVVIDMGAGLTTVGAFLDGHIIYTSTIHIGGEHVTKDIARALSTPLVQAERLKTLYGSALAVAADEREIVRVPQIAEAGEGAKSVVSRADLIRVIHPRIEETFEYVKAKLASKNLSGKHLTRVILTGGASQLPGIVEVATQILERQVRLSRPLSAQKLHPSMNSPSFSTCAGLLDFAQAQYSESIMQHDSRAIGDSLYARLRHWVSENL